MKKNTNKSCIVTSHFAFGEHWVESHAYLGFRPSDGTNWRTQKDLFYKRETRDPQFMHITNGQEIISVYVHGFKIPEMPLMISFGSDATKGRVVLCQRIATKEYIAIHY